MSKQLSLISYPCEAGGKLYEPEKSVISSAFVPNEIFEEFEKLGIFEKFKLFEDVTLEDFVEQTRISDDKIDSALKAIEVSLIRLLESDRVTQIKKIQSDVEIDGLMQDLNAISGIHKLLKLKVENFSGITSAIIKLG